MMWPKHGTAEVYKRGKRYLVRYIDQKQCRAYRTKSQRGAHLFASLSAKEVVVCY